MPHIDIRAPLDEVVHRAWPVAQASDAARQYDVEQLLAAVGNGQAETDPSEVSAQLVTGLVGTVAFDPDETADEVAELMPREALMHRTQAHRRRHTGPATL